MQADKRYIGNGGRKFECYARTSWKSAGEITQGKPKELKPFSKTYSASGACLRLETAVPLNAVIRWSWPKRDFAGVVSYCAYREIGYFVGAQFDPACRWPKAQYRPQHLLDLEQLITRKA